MAPIIKFAIIGIAGGVAIGTIAATAVPSMPIEATPTKSGGDIADNAQPDVQAAADGSQRYANDPPPPMDMPPAQNPPDWSDAGASVHDDYTAGTADPEPQMHADEPDAPVDDRAAQAADAAREAADDARAAGAADVRG
jgi:hypothetical protein